LQVFNLPALSSLREPSALRDLLPGLRRTAAPEVTTASMETLLAILPGPGAAPDLLVIDAPGEEATVIEGLARAGALMRFERIFLHAGAEAQYAGSEGAEALCARLEAAGYRLEGTDATDPDRPCLEFHLPPATRAAAARIAGLETALAEERTARRAAEAAQAEESAARQAAERQAAEAREAVAAAEARAMAAAEARDDARAAAMARAAEVQDLTRDLTARGAALAEATEAADRARAEAEAEAVRAAALETERDAARAEVEAARAEAAEAGAAHAAALEAERAAARAEVETARAQAAAAEAARAAEAEALEGLRSDLSLALRQQTLAARDLEDLRTRHARLLAQKEAQDALLQQLTDRLALAADLMQRLEAPTLTGTETPKRPGLRRSKKAAP
jgi:hypothetical protein